MNCAITHIWNARKCPYCEINRIRKGVLDFVEKREQQAGMHVMSEEELQTLKKLVVE